TANTTSLIYPLSLHDALPISFHIDGVWQFLSWHRCDFRPESGHRLRKTHAIMPSTVLPRPTLPVLLPLGTLTERVIGSCGSKTRSEEHTSELQSRFDLVCRLL